FADTSFSQNIADIQAAAIWLSQNYFAPQLLIGHSLGGAAALAAAPAMESIKAVATIGAPFDPAHSVLHFADKISDADRYGEVEVVLGGRTLTISRNYLEDLAETNPEDYLATLRKPLLLLHSPVDHTVGIDNAQTIFSVTRYPKSLVSLDKVDHLLTKNGAAARTADLIAAWAQQFLDIENEPADVSAEQAVAHLAFGTKFGVVVRNNNHSISVDRTKAHGGKGQGNTPEGLFMSAIAADSAQSIKAAAKDMELDDVSVSLTHIHDSTFERRIDLAGNLSTEQRHVLIHAAKTTPLMGMVSGAYIVDVN
ncbi:MAG: alpha/beta hydrolase, partial [Corynebacterium sp.]|nr:alpha/beta hydrolase [Corynebacterium sp.]